MTTNREIVVGIATEANGKARNGELEFTSACVVEAIRLCTTRNVAVLGVDIFRIRGGMYETTRLSSYALPDRNGTDYAAAINTLAEEFVRMNPADEQHVYLLTVAA